MSAACRLHRHRCPGLKAGSVQLAIRELGLSVMMDLDAFGEELDAIARAARESSTHLVMAALPSWLQVDNASRSDVDRFEISLERAIIDRVRRSGMTTIDLTDALSHRGQLQFWRVDRHLDSAGHRIAGQAIFDELFSQN